MDSASVAELLWDSIRGFAAPFEPPWQAFARLLDHVQKEWRRQPRHRDAIFDRDGWRCTVPARTSRTELLSGYSQVPTSPTASPAGSPMLSWKVQPSLMQRRTVPARLVVFSTTNGALQSGHGCATG
jgi:hypothetical protein